MRGFITDSLRWAKEQVTPYYNKLPDWSYLVPSIGLLAYGAMFVPSYSPGVRTGIVLGLGTSVFSLTTGYDNCKRNMNCRTPPTTHALVHPAVAETTLRGVIQPCIKGALSFCFPSTMRLVLGTDLSCAAAASIIAMPIFIAIVHKMPPQIHQNFSSILYILTGIVQGVLAEKFGFTAAIASHVVHHIVPMTYQKWPFASSS